MLSDVPAGNITDFNPRLTGVGTATTDPRRQFVFLLKLQSPADRGGNCNLAWWQEHGQKLGNFNPRLTGVGTATAPYLIPTTRFSSTDIAKNNDYDISGRKCLQSSVIACAGPKPDCLPAFVREDP